jgi:RNA polymerase sigma-70 factor (ECF subfamily)
VLRDVLDYSVREVADTLAMGESAVKVTHLRARRAMEAYDGERTIPTEELRERTRDALVRFVSALVERDVAAVEAMLREDVRTVNDGGGEYAAARVPVLGPKNVARFYLGVLREDPDTRAEIRLVNGLPALLVEMPGATGRLAPRVLLHLRIDRDGRIRELHAVVASRKLARLRF